MDKNGFTLIELIVTMAIISILSVVAIISVSYRSVDARDASRYSDMSQVRMALALSCSDSEILTFIQSVPINKSYNVEICNLENDSRFLDFTNIHDPKAASSCSLSSDVDSDACSNAAVDFCDYSFGLPSNGDAFPEGTAGIDPCDYWINLYMEGSGYAYMTETGLVE